MDLLRRLAEDPSRTGLFLDVDGVLAPIVPRPDEAGVPDETREELRRLHARYALVACISGRAGDDARRIVGLPELTYVGNHGLELEPGADAWAIRLHDFLSTVDWPELEDKGLTAALHYRSALDEGSAVATLDVVASRARTAGFVARYGRKVLEVLPPLDGNKGTAVRRLVAEHRLRQALYAGDDTTDLDAFAALDGLPLAVRVAVSSAEGPPTLLERGDIVVPSTAAVVELLRRL